MENFQEFSERLSGAAEFRRKHNRPFITVTYAQGMDGSIAMKLKKKIQLSSPAALKLTHRLRAEHDAILLGINTVLADNPFLTVRLVDGPNPQPIVLDSRLRMYPGLNLMQREDCKPLIITAQEIHPQRIAEIGKTGARILPCPLTDDLTIDLHALMERFDNLEMGINSIMVEGGARVISSFSSARLVDQFIITLTPFMLGGLQALELRGSKEGEYLQLKNLKIDRLGEDWVAWAQPVYSRFQNY